MSVRKLKLAAEPKNTKHAAVLTRPSSPIQTESVVVPIHDDDAVEEFSCGRGLNMYTGILTEVCTKSPARSTCQTSEMFRNRTWRQPQLSA